MTDYTVVELWNEQTVQCSATSWLDGDKRHAYWPLICVNDKSYEVCKKQTGFR